VVIWQGLKWLLGIDEESVEELREGARVSIEAERTAFETMLSRAAAAGVEANKDVRVIGLTTSAATEESPGIQPVAKPAPEAQSPGSEPPRDADYCTASSILMLMAIAMVLGFSERALVSFEDRLLGQAAKAPS
jgi:hypothetical protein